MTSTLFSERRRLSATPLVAEHNGRYPSRFGSHPRYSLAAPLAASPVASPATSDFMHKTSRVMHKLMGGKKSHSKKAKHSLAAPLGASPALSESKKKGSKKGSKKHHKRRSLASPLAASTALSESRKKGSKKGSKKHSKKGSKKHSKKGSRKHLIAAPLIAERRRLAPSPLIAERRRLDAAPLAATALSEKRTHKTRKLSTIQKAKNDFMRTHLKGHVSGSSKSSKMAAQNSKMRRASALWMQDRDKIVKNYISKHRGSSKKSGSKKSGSKKSSSRRMMSLSYLLKYK